MTTAAIKIKSLTKNFNSTAVLQNISLEIPQGSLFALVGPDGAGKSTLMRILAGIMDYQQGGIEYFNESFADNFEKIKSNIGYMPQRFGLYEDLTVIENIHFFADLFLVKKRERKIKIARLLSFSRLEPFQKRLTGKLSGGMKQKLGLACALISDPKILLLDEPTIGVDPVSRRDFWQLLYELNREGTTIVVSSSYMDEAERASNYALIRQGELLSVGKPLEARQNFKLNVFELSGVDPRMLKLSINSNGLFISAHIFGKTLHLLTNPEVCEDDIKNVLISSEFENVKVEKILPSFEDLFINLSGYSNE